MSLRCAQVYPYISAISPAAYYAAAVDNMQYLWSRIHLKPYGNPAFISHMHLTLTKTLSISAPYALKTVQFSSSIKSMPLVPRTSYGYSSQNALEILTDHGVGSHLIGVQFPSSNPSRVHLANQPYPCPLHLTCISDIRSLLLSLSFLPLH